MTYLEKFLKDNPGRTRGHVIRYECILDSFRHVDRPNDCFVENGSPEHISCKACWDREIPETESTDDMSDGEILSNLARKHATIAEVEPDEIDKMMIARAEKSATKVICISGKAQHGKDTTAGFLKEALESRGKSVLIAHYGDLVKYVCQMFFDWDGRKDENGRTILQYVGTDIIRAKTPNYWVDFVLSILDHFPDKWDYVLIPDCRFPNEIECIEKAGWDTIHIRVVRSGNDFVSPLTEEQQKHPSETALDNVAPDVLILNCDTLEFLKKYICEIVKYMEEL